MSGVRRAGFDRLDERFGFRRDRLGFRFGGQTFRVPALGLLFADPVDAFIGQNTKQPGHEDPGRLNPVHSLDRGQPGS